MLFVSAHKKLAARQFKGEYNAIIIFIIIACGHPCQHYR